MYEPDYTDSLRADILPSYSDSLMHHGIKGQKWGVRRYQYFDGSLTPEGRLRYYGKVYHSMSDNHKNDISLAASRAGIKIKKNTDITISKVQKDPNYDPSTGLVRKNKETSAKSDMESVNPNIIQKNGNITYVHARYAYNCSHCTVAYDLRRRGFDVAAHPSDNLYGQSGETIRKFYKNAENRTTDVAFKSNVVKNQNAHEISDDDFRKLYRESYMCARANPEEYKEAMQKQGEYVLKTCESYGPNARGNISMRFALGGGHSLAFENDSNGNTTFIDTQTYAMKRSPYKPGGKYSDYYKQVICKSDPFFKANVMRYDNAEPDYKFLLDNKIICNPVTVTATNNSLFDHSTSQFRMTQYS